VLPTVRGYRPSWLAADSLAGLTLVAVVVPSQMATARLAGLSVVAGLYAFAAGALLYALLGTDPHLSVGADSTIAPVLAVGVASVAAVGSSGYGSAMAFTAIVFGVILIAVGLVRLGWISELLSTPVITGVLAGIAVGIIARELPIVFGVAGGGTTTIDQIGDLLGQLGHINFWSLGIALGVLAIIVAAQRLSHRLPGALLGLVLSIVAVDALALRAQHRVAVVGSIHGGLPSLALPTVSWSQLQSLVPTVLTVAFLCIAQTAATVRRSGAASEPTAGDFNRDLIAVGAGSVAAGLIGTLASGGTRGPTTGSLGTSADPRRRSPGCSSTWSTRRSGTGTPNYFRSRIRQLLRAQAGRVRTVIIDADAMSDIDYTGLQALRGVASELARSGVAMGIARASHLVHHDLKHGALIEQLGADHLFASVDDAVAGLRSRA
jgi:MFS superfamily sulfate permease-like transporter